MEASSACSLQARSMLGIPHAPIAIHGHCLRQQQRSPTTDHRKTASFQVLRALSRWMGAQVHNMVYLEKMVDFDLRPFSSTQYWPVNQNRNATLPLIVFTATPKFLRLCCELCYFFSPTLALPQAICHRSCSTMIQDTDISTRCFPTSTNRKLSPRCSACNFRDFHTFKQHMSAFHLQFTTVNNRIQGQRDLWSLVSCFSQELKCCWSQTCPVHVAPMPLS